MMRKRFGRSLSIPLPKPSKLRGVGSTTLPSRFNAGSLSHLRSLLTWHSHRQQQPLPILDALSRLSLLHSSLHDLALVDPTTASTWPTRALDDFLRFADAYSSLRSAVIALRHSHSATSSAIRRQILDEPKITASLRAQRRAEKDLLKTSASIKNVGKYWGPTPPTNSDTTAVVREVVLAMATATAEIVTRIAELSAAAVSNYTSGVMSSASSCVMKLMAPVKMTEESRWRESALEKMDELEVCMVEVEKRCEGLFRTALNSTVLLLNILTPFI